MIEKLLLLLLWTHASVVLGWPTTDEEALRHSAAVESTGRGDPGTDSNQVMTEDNYDSVFDEEPPYNNFVDTDLETASLLTRAKSLDLCRQPTPSGKGKFPCQGITSFGRNVWECPLECKCFYPNGYSRAKTNP
jgi:hypothetical protein